MPYHLLWFKFLNDGIHGNIIKTIKSLYAQLSASVLTQEGITEFFQVKIGTRQGCLLSPLFFIVEVNTPIQNCKQSGNNGVFTNVKVDNAASLMFADDLNQITV